MKHRPVVCILDNDKERCLREERSLDAAIAAKKLPISGISNYGANHLARTGWKASLPLRWTACISVPDSGTRSLITTRSAIFWICL